MVKRIIYHFRNIMKMIIQSYILPIVYEYAKLKYRGRKTLIVFADAHHTSLPFSLEAMYNYVVDQGIEPVCHFFDYTHEGAFKSLFHSIAFMDILAQAKYVFICDTFVPASSGRKCKDTKVVQLCHYSGPIKKIGYDTPDDIPIYYKGNVFQNYDLITASSKTYEPLLASAMRQESHKVKALGVSRSDVYYKEEWVEACKREFYMRHPEAKGKKVLLWAPTFRGKASSPDLLNNQRISELQKKLGEEWLVLIKHHPHVDAVMTDVRYRSNCNIPSEKLLPVVDLLITDYSTIVLDYLTFERPFILYAPDYKEYRETRGFYVDYRSITKNMTTDAAELEEMIGRVYKEWQDGDREDILRCKQIFTEACDGNATERIWKYLHDQES